MFEKYADIRKAVSPGSYSPSVDLQVLPLFEFSAKHITAEQALVIVFLVIFGLTYVVFRNVNGFIHHNPVDVFVARRLKKDKPFSGALVSSLEFWRILLSTIQSK